MLSLRVIFYADLMFLTGAWNALRARTLDMMVLVAIAVGTGWRHSVVVTPTGGGDVFYEAAAVLFAFVLLGHWLEMGARSGASTAIRHLLDLTPAKAVVQRDTVEIELLTPKVQVGGTVLVRPCAQVPVDGVVAAGESEVDELMVTNENLPTHKSVGSPVVGATINVNGILRVTATKVGSDTALAQIVNLVQQAQNSKAPGQRLADRAAFWLALVALTGGLLTFLFWVTIGGRTVSEAMLLAITVVVVTCPDALGLATPMAIMIGSGLGAKRGVLFKNATALEALATVRTVVMDKTGILITGHPEVVRADAVGQTTQGDLVRWASAVETDQNIRSRKQWSPTHRSKSQVAMRSPPALRTSPVPEQSLPSWAVESRSGTAASWTFSTSRWPSSDRSWTRWPYPSARWLRLRLRSMASRLMRSPSRTHRARPQSRRSPTGGHWTSRP